MRLLIQRVSAASVRVDGQSIGAIGPGLCVFACAMQGDTDTDTAFAARKIATLRIFQDAEGKMNLDLQQTGGSVLLVSQFTLAADTTSGTRPSFSRAADAQTAQHMLGTVAAALVEQGIKVEQGSFGAKMAVEIHNDGPVTIAVDSQSKS